MPSHQYIGLMTGTSVDAVDVALIDISSHQAVLLASHGQSIPDGLRQKIRQISNGKNDTLHNICQLDQELARLYADCIHTLMKNQGINACDIRAIGSHGQTVRHRPDADIPYTLQLGNGSYLARQTGIATINDFRQADMACGGQGAPLAPAFHHHLFYSDKEDRCCINLGGIANISILYHDGNIAGLDTGPANTLMDQWIDHHHQRRYDKDARWASQGDIEHALLASLLAEPWLTKNPPKSTGPELFNLKWLQQHHVDQYPKENVQRTLCEFSAITIANAVTQYAASCHTIILCGGGTCNPLLVERLGVHLGNRSLRSAHDYGIAPQWIEAAMAAWLAHCCLNDIPANIPAVTGARKKVVLGTIHPV